MEIQHNGETVTLSRGNYVSKQTALRAFTDTFGVAFTATVSLPVPPASNCLWIKDWSENEGVLDSLVKAGVVKPTGRVQATGFVEAHEAELLVKIENTF